MSHCGLQVVFAKSCCAQREDTSMSHQSLSGKAIDTEYAVWCLHGLEGGTHPLPACPLRGRWGRPPEDASSLLSAKALFAPALPTYAAIASRGAWLSALLSVPSAESLCFACKTRSRF